MTILTRIFDPLYGRVSLTAEEYGLIRLPEVQRLRGIRMCNINSLLVTGASEITRFEHSIGVLRLAQEWVSHHSISENHGIEIIAAALLHDMQTGPFGHSLQYVLEENEIEGEFKHDDVAHGAAHTYYQDIDAAATFAGRPFGAEKFLGQHWQSVSNMIKGQGDFGPLISGTMDLDNIDNVVRLAYHVGVADKADAEIALSLARDMSVQHGMLCFSADSVKKIEKWQEIRAALYGLLLLDWAEFSAKAMLTRAIEIAVASKKLGASDWVHTDAELLNLLEKETIGETQAVGELVKRLRVGDLYDPIILCSSPNIEAYELSSMPNSKFEIEKKICEFARITFGLNLKLIVHFILDKKKTRRSIPILIRESNELQIIGQDSKSLLVGVFSARDKIPEKHLPALREYIFSLMEKAGVAELEDIADPMASHVEFNATGKQLSLI
jgi:HD superfamily phosphohydrolase